jgi:hypothetical protein
MGNLLFAIVFVSTLLEARRMRIGGGAHTDFGRGARCSWLYCAEEVAWVVEAAAVGTIEGAWMMTVVPF